MPLGLSSPDPGLVDTENTWFVTGTLPGSTVFLAVAQADGATAVSGCPETTLDLDQPVLVGSAIADASGAATIRRYVPVGAGGPDRALPGRQPRHLPGEPASPLRVRVSVGRRAQRLQGAEDLGCSASVAGVGTRSPLPAHRRADTVLPVGCLVFDVDEGDPDAAFARWPGLLAVMHTTWSHRSGSPRYRQALPLARPVPGHLWSQAWATAAARTPEADPACKDPSRLYFRPAVSAPGALHASQGPRRVQKARAWRRRQASGAYGHDPVRPTQVGRSLSRFRSPLPSTESTPMR